MNPDPTSADLRTAIAAAIIAAAPDLTDELDGVGDDADLFEEFGLDSMDRMNIMTAIAESTGVAIPDDAYPHLNSMSRLIDHLS